MANPEHLKILKQGVKVWNAWRDENPGSWADVSGAELTNATLKHANLFGADMKGADLRGAYFAGAILEGADLSHADLTRAFLVHSNLRRSNLREANFSNAHLWETVFADVDLSTVKHLDSCEHYGPSIIDHRTLAKSGPLPLVFLRGCGLPDTLIEYLPSLFNQPIQFYSCFISYSTKDQEFADRLHADLQNKGVRCWFAPHEMRGGKKTYEQIDEAIRVYDRLLLILSDHSMNSDWVKTEIALAQQKKRNEGREVLFPIGLAPFEKVRDWKNVYANEISEYFIPDFSHWKDHDSYQAAFARLVKDLKTHGVQQANSPNSLAKGAGERRFRRRRSAP